MSGQVTKNTRSAEVLAAREKGLPEPDILPHPDDVIIDRSSGVTIDGPMIREDIGTVQKAKQLITAVLLQEALEMRRNRVKGEPEQVPGTPLMFAIWLNRSALNKRMRFTDDEMIDMRMRFRGLSIRELEKLAFRMWKASGVSVKRGAFIWSNNVAASIMQFSANATVIIASKDQTDGQKNEALSLLIRRMFG